MSSSKPPPPTKRSHLRRQRRPWNSLQRLPRHLSPRELAPYLDRNCVRTPVHISSSESEQAKARTDETILAAVVIHDSITMIAAVVFDGQAPLVIEHVRPAQETAVVVVDGDLNLRAREPGQHQEHS